jgi:hypothetical protein
MGFQIVSFVDTVYYVTNRLTFIAPVTCNRPNGITSVNRDSFGAVNGFFCEEHGHADIQRNAETKSGKNVFHDFSSSKKYSFYRKQTPILWVNKHTK